jgi:hypothetical protein
VNEQARAPQLARKWARTCALMLAFGCVSMTGGVAAAEEPPATADDCVSFENRVGDKQISVQVQNSCDIRLSCNLKYTVRCSASDGSESSSSAKAEAFKLGRKGKHELSLSAESCKQNWDIDQIQWECV